MGFFNKLLKTKYGAYAINPDEYESIGSHWIALYVNGDNVTCFDRFGVEHIAKEIRKFIGNKNITRNFFSMQAYDSICVHNFVLDLLTLC